MTRATTAAWKTVPLASVIAEVQPGFACGERDANGVIQLRMNNVDTRGGMVWDSFLRVPATPEAIERFRLKPGDVLFNNTNSTDLVGKSALFVGHDEPVVFSNHFTRLRVKTDQCSPDFLALWLLQQWQTGVFARLCNRWIGQSAVKGDKLLALSFPLPPLAEQGRIANTLRRQMSAAGRADRSASEQQNVLESIHSCFASRALRALDAPFRSVHDLCLSIDYGFTASADRRLSNPRFLRITDIQRGSVDWDSVPGCSIDASSEPAYRLAHGDILFARTGATTGKSFLVVDPPPAVFASYLIRLRPRGEVLPEYLYAFFQTPDYWAQIRGFARGGAQPNVNASLLGRITLPVPPVKEQRRLAERLSAQASVLIRATNAARERERALRALPGALLRDAFSGRL